MIAAEDLTGVDRSVALRVLAEARTIAPCLDSLEGEDQQTAVAILTGVAAEVPTPGSRRVRSRSRNGTSVTLDPYRSAFTGGDIVSLRALCGDTTAAGAPVGSFPAGGTVGRVWPE